ncbi:tetraacyldisaccharide 4'-kinase [Piscirickettsia litoralis]|uniref:Tetraacyldisaccharide 4'-kinase n=1 Tax=Piscirickettsia litoralis TaxID=1891921 RepID=A0ABX3A0C5_9GAMM|nr:tetraacyldisaccharide 4'-kinase [Piscirickettsia litoralis]ODN41928.1 tetraacyldisaccharide 4'-kinase [Piscirickettsia litoralis]
MKLIERIWYHNHLLRWGLWPFSWAFRCIAALRKLVFKLGLCKPYISTVPVIIVGNIHVGGVGKTPLILKLIQHFQNNNLNAGVVSRGYGAKASVYPYEVALNSSALEAGDEPLMIKQLTEIPVVIAPKRAEAVNYLTDHYKLDVILSDDGLQHYALDRTVEIVVMDAERLGNGMCLPAGPMRESWSRLDQVDFVIVNNMGDHQSDPRLQRLETPVFSASLQARYWSNLQTGEQVATGYFKGQEVNVIAGIGHPERFFKTCRDLGVIICDSQEFADHHDYCQADFAKFSSERPILMTEKDAVKCKAWVGKNAWALHVELELQSEQNFFAQLVSKVVN